MNNDREHKTLLNENSLAPSAYLLFTGAPCCPDMDELKGVFTDATLLKKAFLDLNQKKSTSSDTCRFLKPFVYEMPLNTLIDGLYMNENQVNLMGKDEILDLTEEKCVENSIRRTPKKYREGLISDSLDGFEIGYVMLTFGDEFPYLEFVEVKDGEETLKIDYRGHKNLIFGHTIVVDVPEKRIRFGLKFRENSVHAYMMRWPLRLPLNFKNIGTRTLQCMTRYGDTLPEPGIVWTVCGTPSAEDIIRKLKKELRDLVCIDADSSDVNNLFTLEKSELFRRLGDKVSLLWHKGIEEIFEIYLHEIA